MDTQVSSSSFSKKTIGGTKTVDCPPVFRDCVGLLRTTWDKPPEDFGTKRSAGTAVLIDPLHILTCAHNIVDIAGARAVSIDFCPGFLPDSADTAPSETPLVVSSAWYVGRYHENKRMWDIAVLKLASPCSGIGEFPTLAEDLESKIPKSSGWMDIPKVDLNLTLRGYRFGHGSFEVVELDARTQQILYMLPTETGASGSPLFAGTMIYGIHHCHEDKSGRSFGCGLFPAVLQFVGAARSAKETGSFLNAM